MGYFDLLNGPVYPVLVKDFWPRCDIITQEDVDKEYALKVAEDPENNKGKSRKDLGLREFIETKIRSGVTGYEVNITQSTIAELMKIPNQGIFMTFTPTSGKSSTFVKRIAKKCYLDENAEPTNKASDMKPIQRCAVVKRIQEAEAHDLLEEQRASFINGHTLANMRLLKEAIKTPNHPLLVKKVQAFIPEQSPMMFDNESKDVVLEYMRLMKAEGITITGADIAHVPSEDKKR
ncbi:cullin-like protein, partial [Trifolium medium]|nr:cullin-like protein [Trifolium medium]